MDTEKHLKDIITEEDELQIKRRLDPIIDDWIRSNYPNLVVPHNFGRIVYSLARNCYLTGMLVDGVMAQLAIEEKEKENK